MAALRLGRKVDIVSEGLEEYPITVVVMGEPRILPASAQIVNGELVPWRSHRIVKFYSDLGFRTVKVTDIVLR